MSTAVESAIRLRADMRVIRLGSRVRHRELWVKSSPRRDRRVSQREDAVQVLDDGQPRTGETALGSFTVTMSGHHVSHCLDCRDDHGQHGKQVV